MNFILTSLWLIGSTLSGYWIGKTFSPGKEVFFAFIFFFVALMIRVLITAFRSPGGGKYSGSNYDDDGFFSFFDGFGNGSDCSDGGWSGDGD